MINSAVDGKTTVLGIIGNPVKHTLSPFIHNTIAAKTGDSSVYVPFNVGGRLVGDAVNGAYALNVRGLNVTAPHKKAVIPYLCALDRRAEAAGAVNTLKYTENGYMGYNTDITGVVNTVRFAGVDLRGQRVAVLGAGGSARAVVTALCELGAESVYIVNRTVATAEELAENIRRYYTVNIDCLSYTDIAIIKNAAAIIQTTTLGFGEQANLSPVSDFSVFDHAPFVLDIIYSPWETVFMRDAKARGCRVVNGFDMLVFQAVASYEIWTGKSFDAAFVLDLKEELSVFLLSRANE